MDMNRIGFCRKQNQWFVGIRIVVRPVLTGTYELLPYSVANDEALVLTC